MLTFDEAWSKLNPEHKPSILLGNGFSQAWNANIFSYANLLAIADFGGREQTIRDLFARLKTYDFESVMRALLLSQIVLQTYKADQKLIEEIIADQASLKNSLLDAISKSHPSLPTEVTHDQYKVARKFLSAFGQIFTVNYDLLMYWARNKNEIEPIKWRTDDGFRHPCLWKSYGHEQNVHFLHGGLHIFESAIGVEKHKYNKDKETIIDQVRENLKENRFPLFVSEPTYQKKKQRVDKSPYLTYCFRALQEIKGAVFIYGHSLDENDSHIFNTIELSEVSQVFVSVFGDENSEANRTVKANARKHFDKPGCSVEFFDASSAKIWS